ncbi:MAG: signal peptidase I [bacterium]|nr:signal peptidase I [bacterium]
MEQNKGPEEFPEHKVSRRNEAFAFIWETVKIIGLSLIIIIPIRYFIVQPFFVKGASMEQTFEDGEYILIDEISYRFKEPERGDIVVFRFPEDKSKFFIKRVIGLPGETVEIKNDQVFIFNSASPDGLKLDESGYISSGQHTVGNMKVKLDQKEYFVMGDNRLESYDSRRWGAVGRSSITGRVFFRAWPVSRFGTI